MSRKGTVILSIFLVALFFFVNGVYAEEKTEPSASPNNVSFAKLTRPAKDENVFSSSYVICGVTDNKDVKVHLLRYNEKTKKYVDFKNGESTWEINQSGVFMKKITLTEKINKIKVVFSKKDQPNVEQEDEYTITVLEDSFKDAIKDELNDLWYLY